MFGRVHCCLFCYAVQNRAMEIHHSELDLITPEAA